MGGVPVHVKANTLLIFLVTLPRRHRVPSWSPSAASPMGPPSPTGSAATISLPFVKARPKYSNLGDNLGPRTTADGKRSSVC